MVDLFIVNRTDVADVKIVGDGMNHESEWIPKTYNISDLLPKSKVNMSRIPLATTRAPLPIVMRLLPISACRDRYRIYRNYYNFLHHAPILPHLAMRVVIPL
jgi:hypothetical protein